MNQVAATGYASVGARFGALIIDWLISLGITIAGVMVAAGAGGESDSVLVFLLIALYLVPLVYPLMMIVRIGRRGQSFGHQAVGVRVVDADTGLPIGGGRSFARWIVRSLGAVPFLLGLLWALWEPRRRGWHDIAVNSVVVPAGAVPMPRSPAGLGSTAAIASVFVDANPPPPPPQSPPVSLTPPPPVAPAPPSSPAAASIAPPVPTPLVVESSGTSFGNSDDNTWARPRGSAPPDALLAPVLTPASYYVVFDDGRRERLDGTIVIGRDPKPAANDLRPTLVSVLDATMSVSKTHMAVGLEGGTPWVEDRHSTNGVTLSTHGQSLKIASGRRMPVTAGATIAFGDRSFRVVSE